MWRSPQYAAARAGSEAPSGSRRHRYAAQPRYQLLVFKSAPGGFIRRPPAAKKQSVSGQISSIEHLTVQRASLTQASLPERADSRAFPQKRAITGLLVGRELSSASGTTAGESLLSGLPKGPGATQKEASTCTTICAGRCPQGELTVLGEDLPRSGIPRSSSARRGPTTVAADPHLATT